MKLKKSIITVACCSLLLSLASCQISDNKKADTGESTSESGSDNNGGSDNNVSGETGDSELDAALAAVENYNPEDYVELGEYKGIKINVYVSEDDVDSAIMNLLSQNTSVEQIYDGKVKEGDTVNIKFVGKMNGEEFQGGTSESYDLVIGSHSFIDGFEDGMIGMAVGETKTLHLKFPDPYKTNPDYSGKDVNFEVTVNYINGKTIVPEFNDEFVKKYTEEKYTSAEEYRKVMKQQLEDNKRNSAGDEAFNTVLNTSKVNEVPDYLVNIMKLRLDASYRQMAKTNGNTDFDQFITEKWGMTKDQYDEQLTKTSENYVKQKLIAEAIASKEKIEVTEEEYKESLDQYMKNMNITSEDEFDKYVVTNFRSRARDLINEAVLTEKVLQLVKDNVVEVNEPEETASPEATSNTDTSPADEDIKPEDKDVSAKEKTSDKTDGKKKKNKK